ncbi:hypothetical protein NDU88_001033 [Pleurodeles waltl]|uniref:Uncharacterized protein n=1 Tax=Pleurodeles waltl TaxID=8319 RepID=A0AAV7WKB2_PLEWA|nr:hypothetical protein NDU88_001033 [Pleurodeles waltl]
MFLPVTGRSVPQLHATPLSRRESASSGITHPEVLPNPNFRVEDAESTTIGEPKKGRGLDWKDGRTEELEVGRSKESEFGRSEESEVGRSGESEEQQGNPPL